MKDNVDFFVCGIAHSKVLLYFKLRNPNNNIKKKKKKKKKVSLRIIYFYKLFIYNFK